MIRRFRSRVPWALLFLSVVLIVGMPLETYPGGFENPPVNEATERLTGPAITGMVVITPGSQDSTNGIYVEFTGRCGPLEVASGLVFLPIAFDEVNINPDAIKAFPPSQLGVAPPECYPPGVAVVKLFTIAVTRFTVSPSVAMADLVVMAVVNK